MKYPVACSLFLVAAVGCGEVSTKDEPDAGPEPDAPAEQPVKVRVLGVEGARSQPTGNPDPNAIAIFVGADGNVIKHGVVGAQGESEALMPQGGMIQTVQVTETSATTRSVFIMTFHDVKPGDVIRSGFPRTLPNTRGTSTSMTGNLAASRTYTHAFHTECGSTSLEGTTALFTFYEGCHGETIDVLGIQTSTTTPPGPSRYALTRSNYVAGEAFDLSANWQPMSNFVATISNLPQDITGLTMRRSTFMRAGAVPAIASQSVDLGDPPAGSAAGSIPYAPNVGVRAGVIATLRKVDAFEQRYEIQTAGIEGAETIDYNELSVPWVSELAYTVAERKLSWKENASGPGSPDIRLTAVSHRYVRDNVNYTAFLYDFSRPSATPSTVTQGLPQDYAEFDPAQQTAATFQTGIIAYVDQSNLDGYDAARVQGLGIITGVGASDLFADQAYRRRVTTGTILPPRGVR